MSARASIAAGGDGSGVWKFLTTFLSAVVLTLLGCIYHLDKDNVRQADIAVLQKQLDQHGSDLKTLNTSVVDLHVDMGEVKYALGITPIAGSGRVKN